MAALWFRLASSKKTGMAQLRVVLAGTAAYDEPCAEAEVSSGQQRVCGLYAIEQQYFLPRRPVPSTESLFSPFHPTAAFRS